MAEQALEGFRNISSQHYTQFETADYKKCLLKSIQEKVSLLGTSIPVKGDGWKGSYKIIIDKFIVYYSFSEKRGISIRVRLRHKVVFWIGGKVMYRIAILSDIHGNIYALNAVLKDIKEKAVDFIYCLGDMIGIGPFSTEVLDTLFDLDNIQMITGNHDELVLAVSRNEPYPKSRINVNPHHEWIAKKLKTNHITKLEKLPRILNPTFHGQNFHLIHYPMNTEMYNAHISKDPFDLTGRPSAKNFLNLNGLNGFSLICFGHDHDEHHFVSNNRTFYNSGSLGCYNEPYARYGIIDIDKNGFHIKQQYIPYELDVYIGELRKINFPRKEIVLQIYR